MNQRINRIRSKNSVPQSSQTSGIVGPAQKIARVALAAASLALAACNTTSSAADQQKEAIRTSTSDTKAGAENGQEKMRPEKPFGSILRFSSRIQNPETRTWHDNILDPAAVTKSFLGSKFHYSTVKTGSYQNTNTHLYHFATLGKKSGHLLEGKDASATLADAINILLETKDEKALNQWIVWMYKKSFGVVLDPRRLKFIWHGKTLQDVQYDAPAGFKRKIVVEVIQKMDDSSISTPGGNDSKKSETQTLLDDKNHLNLPSGVSPFHDIVVPSELLKTDPHFTLDLKSYGTWPDIAASLLLDKILAFNKRKEALSAGKSSQRSAPLIERNDPFMKSLVDFIVKDIPKTNHSDRIMAIVKFVQAFSYKWEYDTDFDRPGLITLFNGGSDCNNLSDLFVQLMQAAGYDSALLHVNFKNDEAVLHLKGGIPAQYFPELQLHAVGKKNWIPIELASKGFSPGTLAFPDENTYNIEVINAHEQPGSATQNAAKTDNALEYTGDGYERLENEAWIWLGKSIQFGGDKEETMDQIAAYVELSEAARSGVLYELNVEELKKRWPNDEWKQGFAKEHKEKDVESIAQRLRELISDPPAIVKPKPRENEKVIVYTQLFEAVQSGQLYELNAEELKRRWPNDEWQQGFAKEQKDRDLATITSKLKKEAYELDKKFYVFSTEQREQLIAYTDLLDAIQSGDLYTLNIDELKRRWPNDEWKQGFAKEHKEKDAATVLSKIKNLLLLPSQTSTLHAKRQESHQVRMGAWIWLGKHIHDKDSRKKTKIISSLKLLDAIESGDLYTLKIDELKERWPNGEWSEGFSRENQENDFAKVITNLKLLLI